MSAAPFTKGDTVRLTKSGKVGTVVAMRQGSANLTLYVKLTGDDGRTFDVSVKAQHVSKVAGS